MTSVVGQGPFRCRVVATRVIVSPCWDDVLMGYRSTNKTVYSAEYHNTAPQGQRYRRRVLAGRVGVRLEEIIVEVVAEAGGEVIEMEVMPDHVHLLAGVPPAVALSELVQKPKGPSSRMLGAELWHLRHLPGLWSPSWFVRDEPGGGPVPARSRPGRQRGRDARRDRWLEGSDHRPVA